MHNSPSSPEKWWDANRKRTNGGLVVGISGEPLLREKVDHGTMGFGDFFHIGKLMINHWKIGLPNQLGYHNFSISPCWWFLDGIGMNWAMITIYLWTFGFRLSDPGCSNLPPKLGWTCSRSGCDLTAWCWDATFHREKRQEHENILGLQCLPSTNIYGLFL